MENVLHVQDMEVVVIKKYIPDMRNTNDTETNVGKLGIYKIEIHHTVYGT